MAFGSPYEGAIEPAEVFRLIARCVELEPEHVYVADTIGRAEPEVVGALCAATRLRWPELPLAVHLHGSGERGLECAIAAVRAGAVQVETSIRGLGGPIVRSPGTEPVGNLATEAVVARFAQTGDRDRARPGRRPGGRGRRGRAAAVSPTLAARLDRLPPFSTHRRLVLVIGLGTFFDLYDIFLGGVLAAVLAEPWQPGHERQGGADRVGVRGHVHRRAHARRARRPVRPAPDVPRQPGDVLGLHAGRGGRAERRVADRAAVRRRARAGGGADPRRHLPERAAAATRPRALPRLGVHGRLRGRAGRGVRRRALRGRARRC